MIIIIIIIIIIIDKDNDNDNSVTDWKWFLEWATACKMPTRKGKVFCNCKSPT